MPRKNPLITPLSKIKDATLDALRHPRDTTGKVVEQARGTVAIGRNVAEGVLGQVAGQVSSRVRGGRGGPTGPAEPERPAAPVTPVPSETPAPHGDPVATTAAKKAPAKKTVPTPADVAKKTGTKAPAKKTPAKKSAATKSAAKKSAAKKSAATKAPATKTTATPADVAKKAAATRTPEPMPDAPGDRLPPRRRDDDQPPLIDPSDTKQVAAEAERGLRDATGPSGG